jgi:DNA-directed RNA polymerase specialized sigma24 family protein
MRHDGREAEIERFLVERGDPLLRTAVPLTGSHEAGEDLLQEALERMLRHWRRIQGNPEGYLRRTLHNLAADGWRRHLLAGSARHWCQPVRAGQPGGATAPRGAWLVQAAALTAIQLDTAPAGSPPVTG